MALRDTASWTVLAAMAYFDEVRVGVTLPQRGHLRKENLGRKDVNPGLKSFNVDAIPRIEYLTPKFPRRCFIIVMNPDNVV
jgi:hypothetical protein